ncbi:MAG: N-acetylmuramoyl-L-alanine amidase [Spirochaetes bacterium]|nr:N-acetylmuramoyl-L-alanine amidase [Spirochaetota bacterium]MBU0957055.1 N-acetylmuramoyl-L-alanine amidase [Spirochaetota bacterium]
MNRLLATSLLLMHLSLASLSALYSQVDEVDDYTAASMYSLSELAQKWNAALVFDPLTLNGHLLAGSDLVRFKVDQAAIVFGGRSLRMLPAVQLVGGTLQIPGQSASVIEEWFALRRSERAASTTVAVILIDPGHGGKDPGATAEHGTGASRISLQEKDLTLKVASDLHRHLRERWPEKTILITRGGDSFPTLEDRVNMANNHDLSVNEAVIYISIHANASFNTSARGFEVWYLNPEYRRTVLDGKKAEGIDQTVLPIINTMLEEEYTTESIFLARSILGGLQNSIGAQTDNRNIRAEEWFVVRNARMPSVLIEMGFITNPEEAALLATDAYLQKVTEGIYNGVTDFVDYFEHRRGQALP